MRKGIVLVCAGLPVPAHIGHVAPVFLTTPNVTRSKILASSKIPIMSSTGAWVYFCTPRTSVWAALCWFPMDVCSKDLEILGIAGCGAICRRKRLSSPLKPM